MPAVAQIDIAAGAAPTTLGSGNGIAEGQILGLVWEGHIILEMKTKLSPVKWRKVFESRYGDSGEIMLVGNELRISNGGTGPLEGTVSSRA